MPVTKQQLARPEFSDQVEVQTQNPIKAIPVSKIEEQKKDLHQEETSQAIPENLASNLGEAKMQKLKDFAELAEKASLFELGMAALGSAATGFQADWLSYMFESFGEYSENHVISAQEGKKSVNPAVAALFKTVAFLFGIKNKEGQSLQTTTDFVKSQDKLIGALNMFTSSISGLFIAFKSLPAAITGKQALDFSSKIPAFHFVSTKILPIVNAALMWMTGTTKRILAFDVQKHAYTKDNKEEIDAAFNSGAQDYICGANSASLMLRQALAAVSPQLANMLEPVLATWIAGSAFKEGYHGFKEREDESPKYQLTALDKSSFGKGFYELTRRVAKPFGLELPELGTLAA